MTHTYKDIFNLHIKYIEFLLEKSLFSHQYTKNISHSGAFVENEIREMFRNILPKRFHVTHGYIVSSHDPAIEPVVSPQVDMIIVDTLVPHSIFLVDKQNGMEIVPKEAVVGIFEIKRKLDKKSLLGAKGKPGALEHLKNIVEKVGIVKTCSDQLLPGGIPIGAGLNGGVHSNPIVGILSLEHVASLTADLPTLVVGSARARTIDSIWISSPFKPPIDIIASLDGFIYGLIDHPTSTNFLIENFRDITRTYRYGLMKKTRTRSQAFILSRIFGFILAYVQKTSGKRASLEAYFFNRSVS